MEQLNSYVSPNLFTKENESLFSSRGSDQPAKDKGEDFEVTVEIPEIIHDIVNEQLDPLPVTSVQVEVPIEIAPPLEPLAGD